MCEVIVGGEQGPPVSLPAQGSRRGSPSAPSTLLHGLYLRISQEEVGPDLVDVAQRGGPSDPQQALQRGQCRWLVGGPSDCPVDLGPSEVLLLQRVHPGTQRIPRWLEAGSPKVVPADPEAREQCRAQASLGRCGKGLS